MSECYTLECLTFNKTLCKGDSGYIVYNIRELATHKEGCSVPLRYGVRDLSDNKIFYRFTI